MSKIQISPIGAMVLLSLGLPGLAAASSPSAYQGTGSLTQGSATTLVPNLFECANGYSRVSPMGEITDLNGKVWTVPADNHFQTGPKAQNLYEECQGLTPANLGQVDQTSVPVVEVDPDGEVITGYIFADNYFELYVNGQLIGVDAVPFTPFNSSIVKFKVSKPYTLAVKVIDWEENLALGSERNRGTQYHPGDGGFIASFSDGTVTNGDWQAQTFYTSPVYDLSCLSEEAGARLSDTCQTRGQNDQSGVYGVHWDIPEDWATQDFNDSTWPQATLYTEDAIGVDNKRSYMNFIDQFSGAGAQFIWSSNVVLDNEVLLRYQVN